MIHPASGLKVDVFVAAQSEFDRQRLDRARPLSVFADRTVSFATAEDVILKKLQYFREGSSEKHLRDIAGVLRIQGERVDRTRIVHWAERLGLSEIWLLVLNRLAGESGTSPPSAP